LTYTPTRIVPVLQPMVFTNLGNDGAATLYVSGMQSGEKVEVYEGVTLVGTATATGNTMTISLSGHSGLPFIGSFKTYFVGGALAYTSETRSVHGNDEYYYGIPIAPDLMVRNSGTEQIASAEAKTKDTHFTISQLFECEDEFDIYIGSTKVKRFLLKNVKQKIDVPKLKIISWTFQDHLAWFKGFVIDKDYGTSYDGEIIKDLVTLSVLSIDTTNVDSINQYTTYTAGDKSALTIMQEFASAADAIFYLNASDYLYYKAKSGLSVIKTVTWSDVLEFGEITTDATELVYKVKVMGGVVGGRQIYVERTKVGISEDVAQLYTHVVSDPTITDWKYAEELADSILDDRQNPKAQLRITVEGDLTVYPGAKVALNLTEIGYVDDYYVVEAVHRVKGGIFLTELLVGHYVPRISLDVATLYERQRVIDRSLTQAREAILSQLSLEAGELSDYEPAYSMIETLTNTEVNLTSAEEKIVLTAGSTTGSATCLLSPSRESFQFWRDVAWRSDVKEGAITVNLLDSRDNTLYSNITSPLDLYPYPGNLDFAECLSSEWTTTNCNVFNSISAIFGTYSLRQAAATGTERKAKYPFTDTISGNDYRYLTFQLYAPVTGTLQVRLHSGAGYYQQTILVTQIDSWEEYVINMTVGDWSVVGSPTGWTSLEAIELILPSAYTGSYVFWDSIRFEKVRYETLKIVFALTRVSAGLASPEIYERVYNYSSGGVFA